MQSAHNLDVKGLQGVTGGLDEVDTGVHSVVHDVHPVNLVLGIEVGIETLLDIVHDWSPRFVIVDEITKTRGINNSQTQTDAVLLNVGTDGLYRYGLWDDVEAGSLTLPRWVEGRVEEGVDESRFAKSRLTDNHDIEVEALSDTLAVPLIRQVGESDVASQLPPHDVPHIASLLGRNFWIG